MLTVRAAVLLVSCVVSASSAYAQGPTIAAAQTALRGCTYEACALRISTGVFSGERVSKGLMGQSEPFGFGGGGLVRAVNAVPSALKEAQAGRGLRIKGSVITVISALASGILTVAALREANSDALTRNLWIATGVSTVATFYGGALVSRSEEHFSRAVWLYNKELPR
jgi:hypothetical protein